MSQGLIERIGIVVSISLAVLTVTGHLMSLERRLTLIESSKLDVVKLEGRLTRIETLLEELHSQNAE